MRLDITVDTIATKYCLMDLDTFRQIPYVRWADDNTGEYGQYDLHVNNDGTCSARQRNFDGSPVVIMKKGNVKLIPRNLVHGLEYILDAELHFFYE